MVCEVAALGTLTDHQSPLAPRADAATGEPAFGYLNWRDEPIPLQTKGDPKTLVAQAVHIPLHIHSGQRPAHSPIKRNRPIMRQKLLGVNFGRCAAVQGRGVRNLSSSNRLSNLWRVLAGSQPVPCRNIPKRTSSVPSTLKDGASTRTAFSKPPDPALGIALVPCRPSTTTESRSGL